MPAPKSASAQKSSAPRAAAGRKATSMTREQQIRAESIRIALQHSAAMGNFADFQGIGVLQRAALVETYITHGMVP